MVSSDRSWVMGELLFRLADLYEDVARTPGESGSSTRPYGLDGFWKEHESERCVLRFELHELLPPDPVKDTLPSCMTSFADESLSTAWISLVSLGMRSEQVCDAASADENIKLDRIHIIMIFCFAKEDQTHSCAHSDRLFAIEAGQALVSILQ
jgi:hypothetical protein